MFVDMGGWVGEVPPGVGCCLKVEGLMQDNWKAITMMELIITHYSGSHSVIMGSLVMSSQSP